MKRKKLDKIMPLVGVGVEVVHENNEVLLKDSLLNSYITLNDSSVFLVELMQKGMSLAEIVEQFKEEYEGEEETIRKDILSFYTMLKKMQIVCDQRSLGYRIHQWFYRLYQRLYPKDRWL